MNTITYINIMQDNENWENSSYGERLKALIKAKGLNASRFSTMANISNAAVSEAMRDPARSYREKTVTAILTTFPDVNPNWLRFGQGKMFLEPGQIAVNSAKDSNTGSVRGDKAKQNGPNVDSNVSALQMEVVGLRADLAGEKRAVKLLEDHIATLKQVIIELRGRNPGTGRPVGYA